MQRVRPLISHAPPAQRPPAEEKALWVRGMRQLVPIANGAGAPQRGIPALERLVLLLALRLRRLRRVPRRPPPAALMPPPHYCRGQLQARNLRLIARALGFTL